MTRELGVSLGITALGVSHGYGLMKIMLAHHVPPGVSSGLENEIGGPPALLSLARQGKLLCGGVCGRGVSFHPTGTITLPRPVMSG